MAPHSSTLAWKIPWMEEPGRLQSIGLLRVGHDWVTSLSLFTFHALEKEMATHSSVLAWRIPGMAEPGGLPSMGSHRVGHEWSDLAAAAAWWKHLHEWAKVSNLQLFCFVFPYHIFRKYSSFSFYTFSIIYFLYKRVKHKSGVFPQIVAKIQTKARRLVRSVMSVEMQEVPLCQGSFICPWF